MSFDKGGAEIAIMSGFYDRFLRSGLVDTIPMTASTYERDLALCADHIILEWEAEYMAENVLGWHCDDCKALSMKVLQLETDIEALVEQRKGLTSHEATVAGFQTTLYSTLQSFLKSLKMPTDVELLVALGSTTDYVSILAKAQRHLQTLLHPWLEVDFYLGTKRQEFILLEQDTKLRIKPCKNIHLGDLVKVNIWVMWNHTKRTFKYLNEVWDRLFEGKALSIEQSEFAHCFRKYLETGEDSKLPIINSSILVERQKSIPAFLQAQMPNIAVPSVWDAIQRRDTRWADLLRMQNAVGAAHRHIVSEYFVLRSLSGYPQQEPRFWQDSSFGGRKPTPVPTRRSFLSGGPSNEQDNLMAQKVPSQRATAANGTNATGNQPPTSISSNLPFRPLQPQNSSSALGYTGTLSSSSDMGVGPRKHAIPRAVTQNSNIVDDSLQSGTLNQPLSNSTQSHEVRVKKRNLFKRIFKKG